MAVSEPQAPATFRMAAEVPDIRGLTSAAQVVRAFERVVVLSVDQGTGQMREELYSPLFMWTDSARRAAPLKQGQSTRLTTLCRTYIYIRVGLKEVPETIETPFGQLRDAALRWSKDEGKEAGGSGTFHERAIAVFKQV